VNDEHSLFCNTKQHKMDQFMEVCLLLLLHEETGHGYGLIEQLSYFGFSQEQLNVSTLYRTLVVSVWEEGGQGPKKRVYNITGSGKMELNHWIQILKVRKTRIDKVIERYEDSSLASRKEVRL